LDSAYLAATSEDKGCRVWEIATVKVVADLIPGKEEKFSYCRFSRDGKLPFLFVSSTKSKHFAMYSPVLLEHTSATLELVLGVSKRNGNL
jgi:hypothetical protein